MVKLEITLDNIDYNSLIENLIPLIIKNKILAKAAKVTASSKLNKVDDKDAYTAGIIENYKDKLIPALQKVADKKGINVTVKDLKASTK